MSGLRYDKNTTLQTDSRHKLESDQTRRGKEKELFWHPRLILVTLFATFKYKLPRNHVKKKVYDSAQMKRLFNLILADR